MRAADLRRLLAGFPLPPIPAVTKDNPHPNVLLCPVLESAHESDSAEMRGLVAGLRAAVVGTIAGWAGSFAESGRRKT